MYLETPASIILSNIIKHILENNIPAILQEEEDLIKEFFIIQHLRTPMHKRISIEIHKISLKLPENIKERVMDIENSRSVDFKEIVKNKFPNLNSKQRREKTTELKKLLKKRLKEDPDFIKNIRNSKQTEEILEAEVKKSEEELERIKIHPDKHSSEILDFKLRNIFSKRVDIDLDNRSIKFLVNNTNIPFVLSDTGIKIICWDYGFKKDLHLYLPIHPKILIEFTQDSKKLEFVDEIFVEEFNQLSKEESLINVYSSSKGALMHLI